MFSALLRPNFADGAFGFGSAVWYSGVVVSGCGFPSMSVGYIAEFRLLISERARRSSKFGGVIAFVAFG